MDLKKPLTYDEQIKRLEFHGLIIKDKKRAKKLLESVNYYRFSGYALQFRKDPAWSDYIEGTTFESVFHLYKMDEILRDTFRKFIEIAEVYYRAQISYGFATMKCTVAPFEQHYDKNNFYNKKGYAEVMKNFQREVGYYKDNPVVKHHQAKYSNKMPLWVIVELMSFSTLSKLYNSMYDSEKDKIAASVGIPKRMLENHLHCLSVLRNKCAHAARLYNTTFMPSAKFPSNFLKKNPQVKNNSLFAYTLVLLQRLPDHHSKQSFVDIIDYVIEEYKNDIDMRLIGFPVNYQTILNRFI